ncbi:MAG: DUF1735 domain-containing protein [Dysgonamonadaceae bacterium]|nr:DUF1735 domain-containing protein [Dysgonamonadaceae bacterium]
MKKYIKFTAMCLLAWVLWGFYGCNEDALFEKEQYEKVLCLLSDDDHIFTVVHSLEEDISTGNFSVIVGGSKHFEEDVTVEFEPETELLDQYNKKNFDINTGKYARQLPANRYSLSSMSLTIKAADKQQYGLLPVQVNTAGLSPDTTYVIPLRIKSVSKYKLNPDKINVLYRIRTKNHYASQSPVTDYSSRGITQAENADAPEALNITKRIVPVSKNSIRFYPGRLNYDDRTATVDELQNNAVFIRINSGNSIDLLPYGTVQIEKIDEYSTDNMYEEVVYGNLNRCTFYLHYKYRTQNNDGTYGEWIIVNESLRIDRNKNE